MSDDGFVQQLKQRRVIRAALLYVALAWVALQAADLLAGAGMMSEQLVRVLILIAVIGFPLTVVASWFLDSPWRDKKSLAVAGDLVIIAAITIAAGLFAWQQWFVSFVRPTIAVQAIEATDTREDTRRIAGRIAYNLRTLLAMQPELQVIGVGRSAPDAEYRVAGTLVQGNEKLRLTLQLFDADGGLAWGESFEEDPDDENQLMNRVLSALFTKLPLLTGASEAVREVLATCKSLPEREALLAHAISRFEEIDGLPAPKRPVAQQLALQYLDEADALCPGWPDVETLRFENTVHAACRQQPTLSLPECN